MKPTSSSPTEQPDHGLPRQSWSDRVGGTNANDNEAEAPVIVPLRNMVNALLSTEDRCPTRQHAERHEAHTIADQIIRKKVQELLPASAMLYVPADELMQVMSALKQAVHSMLNDAHDIATHSGGDFCRHTLASTLEKKIDSHLKQCSYAKNLQKRHNAAHHYAPYMHASAPETGMHTVADIHSRYGGTDKHHGTYHNDNDCSRH